MHADGHAGQAAASRIGLATSATAHCLAGCGVGEVVGVVIGVSLGLSRFGTMSLAVSLGFVFGFALGMLPLLRAGFSTKRAFRQVLIAEGLSILVMETAEVIVELNTPGVMTGGLSSPVFWLGMGAALLAGFVAAWPVNYWLIGRGVTHVH